MFILKKGIVGESIQDYLVPAANSDATNCEGFSAHTYQIVSNNVL
jgi:hypothetical protein